MPGQALGNAMKTGTGEVIPGHNHILTDTTDQVIMIHIEAIPGLRDNHHHPRSSS